MSDLSSVGAVGVGKKTPSLVSKPEASVTTMIETNKGATATDCVMLEQIKNDLKEAEYAYTLMMDLKERLQKAYRDLSLSDE